MDDERKNANPPVRQTRLAIARLVVRSSAISLRLFRLGGHSQQIDDVGFAFEGPWISLDEAMIDRNLADLAKLVFADTDIRKAAG